MVTFKLPPLTFKRPKTPSSPAENTVQAWVPIQDIGDGVMYSKERKPIAVLRVQPASFTLLSDRERERRIQALFEAIQTVPGDIQIIAVPRPIDLENYLRSLDAMQGEASGTRKRVLRGYLSYVREIARGAEAMEKRFFVLIQGEVNREHEVLAKARELVVNLGRAELHSHICDYGEILDLQFTFYHSAQAAFERAEGGL